LAAIFLRKFDFGAFGGRPSRVPIQHRERIVAQLYTVAISFFNCHQKFFD
jgi:hypothetical protein